MFCSHCGKPLDPSSRFCPSCGAAVSSASSSIPADPYRTPRLTRPRGQRMIAGVCAAFALHYGWDLNLVRIITALLIVLTGVGALAYIAAWVIIPEAPYALPIKST
ncbi:MAG TPA: PspC domain-containing protein [Edaphobacter sp.]|nr:PspC domain-containing protein [Edaphobacter sp.]